MMMLLIIEATLASAEVSMFLLIEATLASAEVSAGAVAKADQYLMSIVLLHVKLLAIIGKTLQ
jgi:hypothetical protein